MVLAPIPRMHMRQPARLAHFSGIMLAARGCLFSHYSASRLGAGIPHAPAESSCATVKRICRKKEKGTPEQAHSLEDQLPRDLQQEYLLCHVGSGSSKPYYAFVKLNSCPVKMEIDTGASVSVVGEEIFKTIQRGEKSLELQKSSASLRTYNGSEILV